MAYQIGAMILGLLLISAASLWGVNALHQDFSSAMAGYRQLRCLYEVSSHIVIARTFLALEKPDLRAAMKEIQTASALFELSASGGAPGEGRGGGRIANQESKAGIPSIHSSLADAQSRLWPLITDPSANPDLSPVLAQLNRALKDVSDLATQVRQSIQLSQSAADHKSRTTMLILLVLSALIVAAAAILGLLEYRSVMRPLNRLSEGVRRIAQGHLSERIQPIGHAEFASLAADFNRMATELDDLYRSLEQKVAQKSRDLVRSHRLASVGFLAAGVAHEINNPIGIIAGHAELSLQQLRQDAAGPAIPDIQRTLAVIADEAFRCKQIVEKLLSLARGGDEPRRPVSLPEVARSVVSIIAGLKDYRRRCLFLDIQPRQDLTVLASEAEMKQVLLNLTLNALEAVDRPPASDSAGRQVPIPGDAPGQGPANGAAENQQTGIEDLGPHVRIHICRTGDLIELSVEDTGRGMSPDVLERVFEPFFTAKRGASGPGTGLGLSITHAIVESHGGHIAAYSDGPGKGSRFVVHLPALKEGNP